MTGAKSAARLIVWLTKKDGLMVAIFTGEGAGLLRSSANILGGAGQLGGASLGRAGEGVSVNAATGGLVVTQQDEFLAGLGLDISVSRTYNSLGQTSDRDNGDNWQLSSTRRIWQDSASGDMMRLSGDGSVIAYAQGTRGGLTAYWATDGSGTYDRIEQVGGVWTWTDGDSKVQEVYEQSDADPAEYRLLERRGLDHAGDPAHDTVSFTYHANSDRVDRVTTANGEWLEYNWQAANPDNLETIQTGYTDLGSGNPETLTTTHYSYDGQNRLSAVTTDLSPDDEDITIGDTYTVTYGYEGSTNRITSISQDDGSALAITYDAQGRVLSVAQTVSTGNTRLTQLNYQSDHTIITAPDGTTTRLDYVPVEQSPVNLIDPDMTGWYVYNSQYVTVTDTLNPIDGHPVYRIEGGASEHLSRIDTANISATPGETYTYRVSLKASSPSTTTQELLFWSNTGGAITVDGEVLSGPGSFDEKTPGSATWVLSGLSATEYTTIEFTRTIDPTANSGLTKVFMYHRHADGFDTGEELHAYGAAFYEGAVNAAPLANAGMLTKITTTPVAGAGTEQVVQFEYNASGDLTKVIDSESDETLYEYDDRGNLTKITRPDGGYTVREYGSSAAPQPPANLIDPDMTGWYVYNSQYVTVTDTLNPIDGHPVYRIEGGASEHLSRIDTANISATPGETYTYRVSLKASSPSTTTQELLFWSNTGGAITVDGEVLSGPGSFDEKTPGSATWVLSGLSATEYTTIEFTRTIDPTANSGLTKVFMYHRHADGFDAGEELHAYGAAFYEGAVNAAPAVEDLLVSETYHGPAGSSLTPLETRYVYDSEGHLAFAVDAQNRVTEYRYTAEGLLEYTITYPGDANTVPPGDMDLAAMEAWRDALTDRSNIEKTYTLYDARGNIVSTRRDAISNADGTAPTGSTDTDTLRYYTYDQEGRLLAQHNAGENSETFTYDGMGRMVASTDLAGGTTTFAFGDTADGNGHTTTTVTTAAGYVSVRTFNQAGELISETGSGGFDVSGTVTYAYDSMGRTRIVTDERGHNSYYVYDDLGRLTGSVSHDLTLTETIYDDAGRGIATVAYNSVVTSHLTELADETAAIRIEDIRPNSDGGDLWAWTVYDGETGLVSQTIDGFGAVTEFAYDAADRLIKTTAYATTIDVSGYRSTQIASLPTAPVAPGVHADDVYSRSFYDASGRMIGALDGAGYLTETVYDDAGRVIEEIAYAQQTDATGTLRESGSFAALRSDVYPVADDAQKRSAHFVYDGRGNLRFEIDDHGGVSELTYDEAGRQTSAIVYAATLSTSDYSYANITTLVVGIADETADRESYTVYNDLGQAAFAVSTANEVTAFAYDTSGRVVSVTAYAALRVTDDLPSHADMVAWASDPARAGDADNRTAYNYYSDGGLLRFAADGEGFVTQYIYDAEGHNIALRHYDDAITVTSATTITQVNDALATAASNQEYAEQTFIYDNLDRLKETRDAVDTLTIYDYNVNGVQSAIHHGATSTTPVDQSTTVYFHDALGRHNRVGSADGQAEYGEVIYAFNAFGEQVQVTDARGNSSAYEYDDRGLLTKVTDADAGETLYEYNAFGEVVKMTDAEGGETYTYYDELGRATTVVDAQLYVTQTVYDRFGQISSVVRFEDPLSAPPSLTSEPVLTVDPAKDAVTGFTYDKAGRAVTSIDAEGYVESYSYNAFGERVGVTARSEQSITAAPSDTGGTTTYQYNNRGLLVSETLPVSSNVYDPVAGQFVEQSTSVTNTYEYDARGNRIKMTEAAGLAEERVTEYTYDDANRLIETRGQARTVRAQSDHVTETLNFVPTETRTYDARGNVTSTVDAAAGKTVHFYDDLDRKIAEVDALGTVTAYEYDKNGNVTTIRIYEDQIAVPGEGGSQGEWDTLNLTPTGDYRETTFTYDALNRMETSTVALDSSTQLGSAVYNQTTSEWEWISTTPGSLTTAYAYDHLGNVVKTTDPNGAEVFAYYDDLSRKTLQVDGEGYATAWTYDSEGNVLSETRYAAQVSGTLIVGTPPVPTATAGEDRVTQYTYDMVGNRLTETRTGVVIHDVNGTTKTEDVTVTYTYNGLGQVLTKTEATGDTITYDYDDAGRLEGEQRDSYTDFNDDLVTPEVAYAYDGLGNLTRTVAHGKVDPNSVGPDDRVSQYEYGAGGLLARMIDAQGNAHEYFYDALGRQIVDQYARTASDGSTVHTEAALTTYDALGRAVERTVASWNGAAWDKGDVATSEYDAFGDMVRSGINGATVAEAQRVWQTESRFDEAGRLYATNGGDGVWKFFGYDANGNQTAAITSAGYDFANLSALTFAQALTKVGQDDVNATYTLYNARNLATEVVEEGRELSSTAAQDFITTRTYNAFGEVITETDAAGATLSYTYSTAGKLLRSESPAVEMTHEDGSTVWVRPSEDYYYDASGRLVATRSANTDDDYLHYGSAANSEATAYSKAGDKGHLTQLTLLAGTGYGGTQALTTSTTYADNGVQTIRYDIHGDARMVIDQLGRTTTHMYDALGRVTQTDHAGVLTDHFTYDEMGQQTARWNSHYGAGNKQTTDYDVQGRVVEQRAFGGDITTTTYSWDATLEAAGTGLTDTGGWIKTTTMANTKTLTETSDSFGRAISKNDLGSNTTDYTYDAAGRLAKSAVGTSSYNYEYFNTGQLSRAFTEVPGLTYFHEPETGQYYTFSGSAVEHGAEYTYDVVGNRLTEYGTTTGGTGAPVWKDHTATYDALGRITSITAESTGTNPEASTDWYYDASGNIRKKAVSWHALDNDGAAQTTQQTADYWFRYDSMNRVVVDRGSLSGAVGAAGTTIERGNGGSAITYDLAGQRKTVTQQAALTQKAWRYTDPYQNVSWYLEFEPFPGGGSWAYTDFGYIGEQRETYSYDDTGRIDTIAIAQQEVQFGFGTPPVLLASMSSDVLRSDFTYNALGQQLSQNDYADDGTTVIVNQTATFNAAGQVTDQYTSTLKADGKTYTSDVSNVYGTSGTAAYALGAVLSSTAANGVIDGGTTTTTNASTTNTFVWREGALQNTIAYDSDTASSSNDVHDTVFTYNALGQMTKADIDDGLPRDVTFSLDELGQVIRRDETRPSNAPAAQSGSPHEVWYRFGEREFGHVTNNGHALNLDHAASIEERQYSAPAAQGTFTGGRTSAHGSGDFAGGLERVNSTHQGSRAGTYTARAGDSLQGVAQQLYGDASLWYRLAEANPGISTGALTPGQQIQLPSGVIRNTNAAQSFKPYDPARAIGDLSPTSPAPPQDKKGCGVVGAILLAAVAIAVAAVVGPQAIAAFSTTATTTTTTTLTVAGITSTATITGTVTTLSAAGAIAAGAATGAVAAAASQAVGVATGIQEKFSWKAVALGALSGAVGGALGKGGLFKNGAFSKVDDTLRAGLRASTSTAVTQGIATAAGLQDSFSWAGVAASGIGAYAGSAFGERIGVERLSSNNTIGNHAANLGVSTVSLLTNAATRSAIEGSNFGRNIEAAVPDVIAQAIHDAVDAGVTIPKEQIEADPVQSGGGGRGLVTSSSTYSKYPNHPTSKFGTDYAAHFGGLSWASDTLHYSGGEFLQDIEDFFDDPLGSISRGIESVIGNGDGVWSEQDAPIIVNGYRQVRDTISSIITKESDLYDRAAITSTRATARISGDRQVPQSHNGSAASSFFDFSFPSLDDFSITLPFNQAWRQQTGPGSYGGLLAGEQARMNGGDPLQVATAQHRGTRAFATGVVGNVAFGVPEVSGGLVAGMATAPATAPIALLTEPAGGYRSPLGNAYNVGVALSPTQLFGGGTTRVAPAVPKGIVYLRTDLTGRLAPYGGQSISEARYFVRQIEHARQHPKSKFEFDVIDTAEPGSALDIAEHNFIQELTNGVAARRSSAVSNMRDPVGAARRPAYGLPEPR